MTFRYLAAAVIASALAALAQAEDPQVSVVDRPDVAQTNPHYGVAKNRYNEVTFDPVKTSELKIEIQFQKGRCGSLIRWRVD